MGGKSPPSDPETLESLRTAYAGLAANYQTSRTQEWQLPALAMSAETILVLAGTQTTGTGAKVGVSAMLVAVLAGTVVIGVRMAQQRRLEAFALDEYERLLLPGPALEKFRLEYSVRQTKREEMLRQRLNRPLSAEPWFYRPWTHATRWAWAGSVWWLLQILLTVGGVLVIWFR